MSLPQGLLYLLYYKKPTGATVCPLHSAAGLTAEVSGNDASRCSKQANSGQSRHKLKLTADCAQNRIKINPSQHHIRHIWPLSLPLAKCCSPSLHCYASPTLWLLWYIHTQSKHRLCEDVAKQPKNNLMGIKGRENRTASALQSTEDGWRGVYCHRGSQESGFSNVPP